MRELSHHTSRVVARVKAGETLDLTEHGRTIARIVPVTDEEPKRPRVKLGGYRSGRPVTEEDLQDELARGFGL
jgi:antitoxin (DNA-binding transcriptional repressor) of toxin-antitoxin stability system